MEKNKSVSAENNEMINAFDKLFENAEKNEHEKKRIIAERDAKMDILNERCHQLTREEYQKQMKELLDEYKKKVLDITNPSEK